MPPLLNTLDHLVLTVTHLDKTIAFYRDVLGMEPVIFGTPPRYALRFGPQKINLHQAGQELEPKAQHPRPGSADLCFLSETPLPDWQVHLDAKGVPIEEGPVARTGAQGPINSIYLRDPDQNLIEIANPVPTPSP